MKEVGLIGSFGLGETLTDGQNVKSNSIYAALQATYSKDEIEILDTHGHSKKTPKALMKSIKMMITCKNIVIMPAQNGVKVFVPLFFLMNHLFHRSLHYVVIGGWLGEYLHNKPKLVTMLKAFDGIYPETSTLLKELSILGLTNCYTFPNFKELPIISINEINRSFNAPYRVCTFSRVMKEKGISDIIEAVSTINREGNRIIYELDIYGKVDSSYETEFEEQLEINKSYVHYKGIVAPDKSVETIRKYYLLVFPTRFATEGIPGTILDAYASGVPVLSARWKSFSDLVDDGITGFGYRQNDISDLISVLIDLAEKPNLVVYAKKNCVEKAKQFLPEVAIHNLTCHFRR